MGRSFFRWLRGELNGFYITSINDCLNRVTEMEKGFLINFYRMQFAKGSISEKDLTGLGQFAGVFLPRIAQTGTRTSMQMSDSYTVNDEEYSERGLFSPDTLSFTYYPDGAEPDINTLAAPLQRSSMTGDLDEVTGYIASNNQEVLDDDGNVLPQAVLTAPPDGQAYTDYYGENFTLLSEAFTSYEKLEPVLYLNLIECFQFIRYNGMSITSLDRLISVIAPDGFVTLDRIETDISHFRLIAFYTIHSDVDIEYKYQRLSLLEWAILAKFPRLAWSPLV